VWDEVGFIFWRGVARYRQLLPIRMIVICVIRVSFRHGLAIITELVGDDAA
jgi:hypothetical protein